MYAAWLFSSKGLVCSTYRAACLLNIVFCCLEWDHRGTPRCPILWIYWPTYAVFFIASGNICSSGFSLILVILSELYFSHSMVKRVGSFIIMTSRFCWDRNWSNDMNHWDMLCIFSSSLAQWSFQRRVDSEILKVSNLRGLWAPLRR